MIVVNITTKVEKNIVDEWLEWAKKFCVRSAAMHVKQCKLFRLMIEDDAPTYVMQLFFENTKEHAIYTNDLSNIYHAEQQGLFGADYVSFETLMEEII